MLSIIVCSVNRKYLLNFEKNVAETIGDNVEYEILAIDNKVMRLSICAAYNRAASEARYPYLLFIHEDVEFLEKGWWAKVMPQTGLRCDRICRHGGYGRLSGRVGTKPQMECA